MSLTHNQFQAELRKRGIEGPLAYMFTLCYEQMVAQSKQLDEMTSMLLNFALLLEKFNTLDDETQTKLKRLERRGLPDGVEILSEAIKQGGD